MLVAKSNFDRAARYAFEDSTLASSVIITAPPLDQQEHPYNGQKQPNGDHSDEQERKSFLQSLEIDQQIQSSRDGYHHDHDHDHDHHDNHHAHDDNRPSNENLLGTAVCSFMSFASIKTVVAVFAKSEAMLGDSAAMIVDSFTYLFNWYSERRKVHFETEEWAMSLELLRDIHEDQEGQRILARTRRKYILQLELIPPIISVSTLVVVMAFVLHKAIRVLILDDNRAITLQGNPNIQKSLHKLIISPEERSLQDSDSEASVESEHAVDRSLLLATLIVTYSIACCTV
jgi:hypothetical protein